MCVFFWEPAGIRTPALMQYIVVFELNHYTTGVTAVGGLAPAVFSAGGLTCLAGTG